MMQFETAMLSNKGRVRDHNEDSCFALEAGRSTNPTTNYYGLYLIADGMGGHQAGEIASSKAVEIISSSILERIIENSVGLDFFQLVLEAIEKANGEIYNMAQSNPAYSGMGTTATIGLRIDNQLYLGHVGDSRAYLIRNKEILQLTHDHSLVASLVKSGMITKAEAMQHPDRHKIFRCLGISPNVSIDTYKETDNRDSLTLQKGDSLVFCTDGLINYTSDVEILKTLNLAKSASDACQQLVYMANERGGDDNISIIVVKSRSSNQTTVRMSTENVRSNFRM